MPQGTIPRGPAFFDPVLKGRWGAARLAAHDRGPGDPGRAVGHREGVAALEPPPATCSTSPTRRSSRVRVGPPVELKHRALDADTKRIMAAISAQLPAEARRPHHPTSAELAATYPPGYRGEPGAEHERRPGTD